MISQKYPTSVTGGNSDWNNISNILTQDTAPGTWGYWDGNNDAGNDNWLVFSSFNFDPNLSTIRGIEIEGLLGLTTDGNVFWIIPNSPGYTPPYSSVEFALSKDGISPAGTIWNIDYSQWGDQGYSRIDPVTIGSPTELHGTSWTPSEIQNVKLLVRIPVLRSGEITTGSIPRGIEYVKLKVYSDPIQVLMHLTGQGFSNGNVNLDWDD